HDIVPRRLINRLVLGWCGRVASVVIPCSQAVADSLLQLGVPPTKIRVVRNSVRPRFSHELPEREPLRRCLGISRETTVLTVIARLVLRKRQDLFLEALGLVLA